VNKQLCNRKVRDFALALRARKVSGAFEKRAPGLEPRPLDPEKSAPTTRSKRLNYGTIGWFVYPQDVNRSFPDFSFDYASISSSDLKLTKSSQYILTAIIAPSVSDGMSSRIRENNLKQKTNMTGSFTLIQEYIIVGIFH